MTQMDLDLKYPDSKKFKLGDSEELSADLIELIRQEKKTATCGALKDFEEGHEAMPEIGRTDIILHWNGKPALAIRTKSVEIKRFCDVTEEFALLEGENETLAGWQEDHKLFFERNGGFTPEMQLVCECFELVDILDDTPKNDS